MRVCMCLCGTKMPVALLFLWMISNPRGSEDCVTLPLQVTERASCRREGNKQAKKTQTLLCLWQAVALPTTFPQTSFPLLLLSCILISAFSTHTHYPPPPQKTEDEEQGRTNTMITYSRCGTSVTNNPSHSDMFVHTCIHTHVQTHTQTGFSRAA